MKHFLTFLLTGILLTGCIPFKNDRESSGEYIPTLENEILLRTTATVQAAQAGEQVIRENPADYLPPTATPTYQPISWRELNVFLASDHTNWNTYDAENYTCVHFAVDLVAMAKAKNIAAWIVTVMYEGSEVGHAFVAFQTTDLGEVWIEPQSDYSYLAPKIGQLLCYVIDTSVCDARVQEIHEHVECDVEKSTCWVP
jgi:hypothetical protein